MKMHDYLPKNETETALIQGRVGKELHQKTRERMKLEKISWDEFMNAACRAFLAEPFKKK